MDDNKINQLSGAVNFLAIYARRHDGVCGRLSLLGSLRNPDESPRWEPGPLIRVGLDFVSKPTLKPALPPAEEFLQLSLGDCTTFLFHKPRSGGGKKWEVSVRRQNMVQTVASFSLCALTQEEAAFIVDLADFLREGYARELKNLEERERLEAAKVAQAHEKEMRRLLARFSEGKNRVVAQEGEQENV